MRVRSFILRSIAFFLLLVFSQKSGAGLLLHNALHTNQASDSPAKQADNKDISFACSCIDDFLTPFAEVNEPMVAAAGEKHETPAEYFTEDIILYTPGFTSLRGPPSCILN
jgi:hypothetical protein